MSYRKLMPTFEFSELAEDDGCVNIVTTVELSRTAQLVYTLQDMKTSAKGLDIKNINDMDEASIANAYAYALRKDYYGRGFHKAGFTNGRKAINCNFFLGSSVKTIPSSADKPKGLPDQLALACRHTALLGDDLNESYVIYEPENYHPENVVNFIRKSVREWETGRVTSNLIRVKNRFIAEGATLTREVPDGWDIPVDYDDED